MAIPQNTWLVTSCGRWAWSWWNSSDRVSLLNADAWISQNSHQLNIVDTRGQNSANVWY